jgi:type VI secretion system protein ImpH
MGALVGDEVWDPQVRARIHLGPLTRDQFAAFLPTGPAHAELRELARLFSGDEVDFEVRLVLKRDEVPRCVLGGEDAGALGWTTWLRTAPLAHDADDTTLTL